MKQVPGLFFFSECLVECNATAAAAAAKQLWETCTFAAGHWYLAPLDGFLRNYGGVGNGMLC